MVGNGAFKMHYRCILKTGQVGSDTAALLLQEAARGLTWAEYPDIEALG
jgi:hypothetical protein